MNTHTKHTDTHNMYSQVLLSLSNSVSFLFLLESILNTIRMMKVATTNVNPDTSKLIITGLMARSVSADTHTHTQISIQYGLKCM